MKLRYKILNGFLISLLLLIAGLAIAMSYTADCEPPTAAADGDRTMKAVTYRCYGSPEVLEFSDVAMPVPGDDEVLVRVFAAGVNPLDWHYMRGEPYFMRLVGAGIGAPVDHRFGVDYSGIVETVGKNVANFQPGDEVFGGTNGAFAEYLTVRSGRGVALKPAQMSFREAAGIGVAGVTALQALRDHGELQAGQSVLINGASGGVGTFAVQIAKSMGAEVTGVCSTRNVELVKNLGADHVIDYKKARYVNSSTKYDLIVDMVGNESLGDNRQVLKSDGKLVIVGGPSGKWLGPMIRPLMALLSSPFVDQEMAMILAIIRQDDLETLADLADNGAITTMVGKTFPLSETAAAVAHSEEGHARGKIILDIYNPDTE